MVPFVRLTDSSSAASEGAEHAAVKIAIATVIVPVFIASPVSNQIFANFVGYRLLGMTVAVIGWLYLFGGRSGGRQVVAASIVDRWVLVPGVLVPLAMAGVYPHSFLAFALLDVSLALGAWVLRNRTT